MGCLIGIDYGTKRTGLAHTDLNQMIASGLAALETSKVLVFLKDYCQSQQVDAFVVGQPRQKDGSYAPVEADILRFINDLNTVLPGVPVKRYDERFTSKIATQTILSSGLKQKKRRDKALVDEISATIILQSYLNSKVYRT